MFISGVLITLTIIGLLFLLVRGAYYIEEHPNTSSDSGLCWFIITLGLITLLCCFIADVVKQKTINEIGQKPIVEKEK